MSKQATLQVRMDGELKAEVESLYKRLGTSFAEAVRIFARQSITEGALPFTVRTRDSHKRPIGIADGKYNIPDNIDEDNDEILKMFGIEP